MGQGFTQLSECQERGPGGLFECCMPGPPPAGGPDPRVLSGDVFTERETRIVGPSWGEGFGVTELVPEAAPPLAPPRPKRKVLCWDLVCSDLEEAETLAWGDAFAAMGAGPQEGQPANLALDCTEMRDFLCHHSNLPADELDAALIPYCPDFTVDLDAFLQVLREHANSDALALRRFMRVSDNGESVKVEACRDGLVALMRVDLFGEWLAAAGASCAEGGEAEEDPNPAQAEKAQDALRLTEQAESRLRLVCAAAVKTVAAGRDRLTMEEWLACSKRAARMVRVCRQALGGDFC